MILLRDYSEEKCLDRVWYSSSNIVYSECDDKENELKTLRVTFKNGATYQYTDVDVNDYVMFVHGGLDASNGKALNKYIKGKYDFTKLEDRSIEDLTNEMNTLLEEKKTQNSDTLQG